MPLPLRVVEPVHVSRMVIHDQFRVRNELEASANGTLANVIRQLSTLSHNAEEIFIDLIQVGTDIASRASNLQARIDRLAVKVVQMDGLQDESTSMQDSLNTKPFQSSMMFDQQVVARHSLPPGMSKIYTVCDRPPPLDKLNKYRDDGKDGLKFYTDPNYFFELWRQDMIKDTERAIYDRVKKPHKPKHEQGGRHKKRVRQPTSTRERQRHVAIEHGEYIIGGINHHSAVREAPDGMYSPEIVQRQNIRPNSIEFKYQNDQAYNNDYRNNQQMHQSHYEAYNNQQSHLNNNQRYYPHAVNSPPPPYESPTPYARQTSTPRSTSSLNQLQNTSNSNGFAFRPSQPPPAPPPAYAGTPPSSHSGTPTRSMRALNSRDREILPPPPPPPVEHMQQNGYQMSSQMNGHVQEQSHYQHHLQYHHQHYDRGISAMLPPPMDDHDEPLPPPPPTPDQTLSALHMAIANLRPTSDDHLPPSPPPPPLDETDFQLQQTDPPPPPPPPPPPVANGNGTIMHNTVSHIVTKLNDPGKRHVPMAVAREGHTELLKAIRDGIALRKVDKKEPGKEEKAGSAYHDVASILARRVAVEMSDSDSGSDSEYDSDVWGDETSA